jgi:hypothetical protein
MGDGLADRPLWQHQRRFSFQNGAFSMSCFLRLTTPQTFRSTYRHVDWMVTIKEYAAGCRGEEDGFSGRVLCSRLTTGTL